MIELVVIGSVALNKVGISRKPNDLDIVGNYKDVIAFMKLKNVIKKCPIQSGKKIIAESTSSDIRMIEAEICWDNSSAKELFDLIKLDPYTICEIDGEVKFYYPSINVLYMLKMSHRYLKNTPYFLKTMEDIHQLRLLGGFIEEKYMTFYKDRMRETYYYKHPNLNSTKKNFFKDEYLYKYDHDKIHEIVAQGDRPAYMNYKIENEEVLCSKELFFSVDEKIRLNGGVEEAMVLALERSQIPNDFKIQPKKSFDMALEKVCTSITSGWFREFCWENYYAIQSLYDENYVDKFKKALADGSITPL